MSQPKFEILNIYSITGFYDVRPIQRMLSRHGGYIISDAGIGTTRRIIYAAPKLLQAEILDEIDAFNREMSAAAEAEVKRLREGIEACNPDEFFIYGGPALACHIWERLSALLAQPSDGKEAEGG